LKPETEEDDGASALQSLGIRKKWNMRSIVIHECKDEIRQLIQDTYDGDVPSGPQYIREFQKGVTAYINELSKEQCAEYEEQARVWNLQGPDPEEQRKYVFPIHSTHTSY